MAKQKTKKKKYKYIRPEEVEAISRESNEDLLLKSVKLYLQENAYKEEKKKDNDLKDLKKEIKDHMDNHDLKSELEEAKAKVKSLGEEIKEEITDQINRKKELEVEHNHNIKATHELLMEVNKEIKKRGI